MKTSLSGALYFTSKFCLGILKLSLSLSFQNNLLFWFALYCFQSGITFKIFNFDLSFGLSRLSDFQVKMQCKFPILNEKISLVIIQGWFSKLTQSIGEHFLWITVVLNSGNDSDSTNTCLSMSITLLCSLTNN